MSTKHFAATLCALTLLATSASPALALSYPGSTAASGGTYAYPSSSLVNDSGTIYFISGTIKVPFTSWTAFTGLGYSLNNVSNGDLSSYILSSNYSINTSAAIHPWGQWLINNGTVYYSTQDGLIPVPSADVFMANGGQWNFVVKANKYDLAESSNLPVLTANDPRVITTPSYSFSGGTSTTTPSEPTAPTAAGELNQPTLSASSTPTQFVAGGGASQNLATFNFSAVGGPVIIQALEFTVQSNSANTTTPPVNSLLINNMSTTVMSGATSTVSGLSINVPANGNIDVPISGSVANINPPSVVANQIFTITLVGVSYTSNQQDQLLPTNVISHNLDLVSSVPTISLSGPTWQLQDGLVQLGEITISANGGSGIILNQLPINLVASGYASSSNNGSANLFINDNSYSVPITGNTVNLAPYGNINNMITFNGDNTIPAGTNKTYTIDMNLLDDPTSSAATTSSVSLSLGDPSQFSFTDVTGNLPGILGSQGGNNFINYSTSSVVSHN